MVYNEIAFADILGYFPTYMRPPYSASNETTNAWLAELGYHVTYFNLDTEGYLHDSPNLIDASKQIWDSTVQGKDPRTNKWLHIEHDPVYQAVCKCLASCEGRGDMSDKTPDNLTEYMLKSIARNKFKPVTVGECLEDPRQNWYRRVTVSQPSTTVRRTSTANTPRDTFPPSTNGRCGSRHGGATCRQQPLGATCCSKHGWCGSSPDACGKGCQPVFGTCKDVPEPGLSTKATTTTTRKTQPTNISRNGRCGPKHGGTTCILEPGATCCSGAGWCGRTKDHCGKSCQIEFGTCGSSR